MTNERVSVIVPVYNTGKYLSACVESILGQSYPYLEVILVDDGSDDGSENICDWYADKDSRVRVVHQENQGVSAARNRGISISTGSYIAFADSDDVVDKRMLETCICYMKEEDLDFLWFNIETCAESGDGYGNISVDTGRTLIASMDQRADLILKSYLEYHMTFSVFNKIYRISFLRKNGIRFDTKIRIGEDLAFNLKCFMAAESVRGISESLYQYWKRDHSAMSAEGPNALYIRDYAFIAESVEDYARSRGIMGRDFLRIYIKLMDRTCRNRKNRGEYREKVKRVENKRYLSHATFRALCHPLIFCELFGKVRGAGRWKDQLYIWWYLWKDKREK